MITYRNCKKLIEMADKKETKTAEYIVDMKDKLDIFLLAGRITDDEYRELTTMLDAE